MNQSSGPPTTDAWKETVRDIFDELHFGTDSVFKGQRRLARRIVSIIETRHHDYFCEGKTMAEWQEEKTHG